MNQRIEEAISLFRDAAMAKGDFVEPVTQDHHYFDEMAAAWRTLSKGGADGETAVKMLLADDSEHVRLWAATQVLATGDESAIQIVESVATSDSANGFSARMVLDQWREGKLTPPFKLG